MKCVYWGTGKGPVVVVAVASEEGKEAEDFVWATFTEWFSCNGTL